jgi:2-methylcitrate dehydratase PrpD
VTGEVTSGVRSASGRAGASATRELAAFAATLELDRLPAEVTERLGLLFLEYLRVASFGERMPWSQWSREMVAALGGRGESYILFSPLQMDAARAAFLNATFAGSLDADDTHVGAMLHPGAVVFSAALAVAQSLHAPGREVLPAVAAGYEAMIRIALSVQPSHFRRGFQSTATCGSFGAAVAAARLLFRGADAAERVASTLGVAASFAGGLTQVFRAGSTAKRIHAAHAAQCGVEAALLVRHGFSGPVDILEGDHGFARAYADSVDFTPLRQGLGRSFRLLEVMVKAHACSARVQSAVDGALALCRQQRLAPEEISEIRVGVPAVIMDRLTFADPPDVQAAQMSLPFSVAIAFVRGDPDLLLGVDEYEWGIRDAAVRALAARVRCEVDPEVEAATTAESVPARISVRLVSGAKRSIYVEAPPGSPSRPFSRHDHVARFCQALEPRLGAVGCARMVAAAMDFAPISDTAWIGTALVGQE